MTDLNSIDHFVVLMLENRSFDNLLGRLYPDDSNFEGLSGEEFNLSANGTPIQVSNNLSGDSSRMMWAPDPDPGEKFVDINEQLFGNENTAGSPSMGGFVKNYAKYANANPSDIMHYFNPDQVPALSALARSYAVCDHWFASAPCQTWPNRFFVHTGTAGGYENNSPVHFPYVMPTIFSALHGVAPSGWNIYFHDFPQSLTLSDLWGKLNHFKKIDNFFSDAKSGALPSYSFIEPRYFVDENWPNDMHPPHNICYGDQLIASVYDALRNSPCWEKTMLIITFDEHGGCFDHVPPPRAPVPEIKKPNQVFGFDRFGVRVPAVVVSPLIRPGTIFRAPAEGQPFDHTSIIKTLRTRYGINKPLTERDRNAPDLSLVINLESPSNDNRLPVVALPAPATDDAAALEKARLAPLSDFQHSLQAAALHLQPLKNAESVALHMKSIVEGWAPKSFMSSNSKDAVPIIRDAIDSLGLKGSS